MIQATDRATGGVRTITDEQFRAEMRDVCGMDEQAARIHHRWVTAERGRYYGVTTTYRQAVCQEGGK